MKQHLPVVRFLQLTQTFIPGSHVLVTITLANWNVKKVFKIVSTNHVPSF